MDPAEEDLPPDKELTESLLRIEKRWPGLIFFLCSDLVLLGKAPTNKEAADGNAPQADGAGIQKS